MGIQPWLIAMTLEYVIACRLSIHIARLYMVWYLPL